MVKILQKTLSVNYGSCLAELHSVFIERDTYVFNTFGLAKKLFFLLQSVFLCMYVRKLQIDGTDRCYPHHYKKFLRKKCYSALQYQPECLMNRETHKRRYLLMVNFVLK